MNRPLDRPRPPHPARPHLRQPNKLILSQRKQLRQPKPQRPRRSRQNLRRRLLTPPLHLGQIGHRNPGRICDILERARLSQPFPPQHLTDHIPPKRLPHHRRHPRHHPRPHKPRAQLNDTASIRLMNVHPSSVERYPPPGSVPILLSAKLGSWAGAGYSAERSPVAAGKVGVGYSSPIRLEQDLGRIPAPQFHYAENS